jgi:NADH-quinone oxidoreductase subunit G
MLKVQVDGVEVEVPHGSTVMDATNKIGVYVPHFCYHRKLSIAANCRMCLVEVEKAPKPLPACATPVTDGMKVWTHSVNAKKAQNGVMEFLLINHPLDCPICDQGGECQLQDLAVGYGHSNSRYTEEKRVVLRKDLGPLVAAEEMSRCIQCTRCVRFGQEIAGVMELGLAGRGENAEIVSFVGKAVDSELSGNMIDICPVGALTSEPFRYKARTWELSRRKSVSPHDGLGSNLVVQVKQNRVMRVLPLDNEAINECWLSDKDRFSYEALNAPERLTRPMLKRQGRWEEVDWSVAIDEAAWGLKGRDLGVLASPHATLEELYLAGKLAQGIPGKTSGAADFRLRQSDFSADGKREGIPWLGMPVAELGALDRVLVVGSFLRKDHPLIAHRLRQAAKRGAKIYVLHSVDDDWLMPIAGKKIVAPSELPGFVSFFENELKTGENPAILLGNFAQQHPQAAQIHAAAQSLGVKLGFLGEAANSVGGYLAGLPVGGNVATVLEKKAILLLNTEPELDCADPRAAMESLRKAEFVVALSAFRTGADYANVILPIGAFTETAGSFVSTEGRVQSFHSTVNPPGETRPGWKVLRVLGTLLGLPGFELDTVEQVRAACLNGRDVAKLLSNKISLEGKQVSEKPQGIQRIADVPIYFADPLVRRSPPLQKTKDARAPRAWMNGRLMARLGVAANQKVLVRQNEGTAKLLAALDERLPDDCVRVAAAHPSTAGLGAMFGAVSVEKIPVTQHDSEQAA